jgi:methylenetetrahydrofolate dehydrogenase (NAD+)
MAHTAAVAAAVNAVSSAAQQPTPLAPTLKRPTATEGVGKLLKADSIAELFRSDIQRTISASRIKPIKLVGILASGSLSNNPSEVYAEFTRKQCETLGVEYVLKKVGGDEGEGQGAIEDAIIEANGDDSVHGILVSISN